jgi:hypothetical protein
MQRHMMIITAMDKGEVCQTVVMVATTADQEVGLWVWRETEDQDGVIATTNAEVEEVEKVAEVQENHRDTTAVAAEV